MLSDESVWYWTVPASEVPYLSASGKQLALHLSMSLSKLDEDIGT